MLGSLSGEPFDGWMGISSLRGEGRRVSGKLALVALLRFGCNRGDDCVHENGSTSTSGKDGGSTSRHSGEEAIAEPAGATGSLGL